MIAHTNKSGTTTEHVVAPTIRAEHHNTADVHFLEKHQCFRRLTPLECERLQGFPDGWTKWGRLDNGKIVEVSDTQRYKCLGNAVTVNVIRTIVANLEAQQEPMI